VNSGNVLVRGLNNFTAFGQFANYYVGDTNHATGAAHGAGLYFSTYHVPYAMTIQDQTGYVGIGFASTPSIPTEHNGVLTVAGHNTDNLLYMRSGAGTFVVDGAGNLFLLETSGAGGNIVADGSIHASGQLDTGSGVKFPDGTV